MELHGCVARWDGDRLTVWESTQGVYAVQARVAEVLGTSSGQCAGDRLLHGRWFWKQITGWKYTIIAALLSKKAARPVKVFLTREETLLCVGNRPPSNMTLKAGVKKTVRSRPRIPVASAREEPTPAGGNTSLVDWLVRDSLSMRECSDEANGCLYQCWPFTSLPSTGTPAGGMALEQMIDALAEAIKMDPVELRLKNIPLYSQAREGKPPYTSTGLKECLKEGAKAFGWNEALKKTSEFNARGGSLRRGVGMAGGLWAAGGVDLLHHPHQALLGWERQSEHGSKRYWNRDQDRDGDGRF